MLSKTADLCLQSITGGQGYKFLQSGKYVSHGNQRQQDRHNTGPDILAYNRMHKPMFITDLVFLTMGRPLERLMNRATVDHTFRSILTAAPLKFSSNGLLIKDQQTKVCKKLGRDHI